MNTVYSEYFEISTALKENIHLLEIAIFLSLFASGIAFLKGYYKWRESYDPALNKVHFKQVFAVFTLFFILMALIIPAISYLWISYEKGTWAPVEKVEMNSVAHGWLNVTAIIVASLGILGYTLLLDKEIKKSILGKNAFVSFSHSIKDFAFGMFSWLLCYPIVLAVNQLFSIIDQLLGIQPKINEQVAVKFLRIAMEYPILLFIMGGLIVFIVPIVEEVLFRGFLQNWFKQGMGRKKAIFLTAAIFALFHFSISQGVYNIELVTSLFILGCYLGFLYERQQSLWSAIGLHSTFNAISVIAIVGKSLTL